MYNHDFVHAYEYTQKQTLIYTVMNADLFIHCSMNEHTQIEFQFKLILSTSIIHQYVCACVYMYIYLHMYMYIYTNIKVKIKRLVYFYIEDIKWN